MKGFEILEKASAEFADVRRVLEHVAAGDSDLAPVAQAALAKLDAELPGVNIANLAAALPHEILNSAQGKFDGRFHPGSAG